MAKFETHLAQELMDVVGSLIDKSRLKINQVQEHENVVVNISEPKTAEVVTSAHPSKEHKSKGKSTLAN